MCSHHEWERLRRRFREAIYEGEEREFLADAATRIEAFVDELKGRSCVPEDADWARLRGQRSSTEWIA